MSGENIIQTVEFKSTFCEYVKEAGAALPDYCPGIFRVIKLTATPFIRGLSPREDGTVIDGQVMFTLLYKTQDDENIYSYTIKEDFSTHVKVQGDCFASAQALYSSCRLTGERRADFKAVINIKITCRQTLERTPFVPPASAVALQKSFDYDMPVAFSSKKFALNYEHEHTDCPTHLLYTEICPVIKETRVLNGRVLVKGEAMIRGVYGYPDGVNRETRDRLAFSQVVDAPNALEGDNCRAFITLADLERSFTPGEKGCMTLCDITLNLFISVTRKSTGKISTDCFCPGCKTENKKAPFGAMSLKEKVSFSSALSYTLNVTDGVKSIRDVAVRLTADGTSFTDNKLKNAGSASIRVIYQNADNETSVYEKTLPYECASPYETTDLLSVYGEIYLMSQESEGTENAITVRIETLCVANLYNMFSETVLTETNLIPDTSAVKSHGDVCLCFAKKGERVWDIAKEFCALPERIKALNGIEGESLSEDRELILPSIILPL